MSPRSSQVLAAAALAVLSSLTVPARGATPEPVAPRMWAPADPATSSARAEGRGLERYRPVRLDRSRMDAALRAAPMEGTPAARHRPVEVSLPAPTGGLRRFAVVESPVMEAGLAARHPEIATYAGEGIDDPAAAVRLSLTSLGLHASVRTPGGWWYVDPLGYDDEHASYFGRDLEDVHGRFVERGPLGTSPQTEAVAATVGDQLRTYRLALVSDPSYADHFGAANVTDAKVALVNRVTQIYEDETAIRLMLVAGNDALNLDTNALATGTNGPCGAERCFTSTQLSGCTGPTLGRNRIVVGQLVGAGNYDVGHLVLGKNGGGIASLGVVGRDQKAQGCTGLPVPEGDFFAVDYVAHELGHQFAANHTFNGTLGNCTGSNRSGPNSVEPGSGSSIMAYAGICGADNLQAHSDPHWSQRSFEEITAYVSDDLSPIDEVQTVSLRTFDGTDSFTLRYEGNDSAVIERGTNYTAAGIVAAIESIPGWPAGSVTAAAWAGGGGPSDVGFRLEFKGDLAETDVSPFQVTNMTGGMDGFVGETAKGGPVDNQGDTVTPTGNTPPEATAPASFTIPYRTPFELTGGATDADADTLTYLWEQNDPGVFAVSLFDPAKTTGPLFRQFGTPLQEPPYVETDYNAAGENHPGTDPSRVFPDMEQILANNTNADTGTCPPGTTAQLIECSSEFLPNPVYAGPMHFRFTVRDGHSPGGGGVDSADTTVHLAAGTGPFRVTSPTTPVAFRPASIHTIRWDPAGTAGAPVGASSVRILLSTDGGQTFPHTLAASTPNDGAQPVTLPAVETADARVKIAAIGNVFFDVSNADFTISASAPPSATVSVGNARVREKNRGGRVVRLPVQLSGPAQEPIDVGFGTRKGTAKPRKDFRPASGTLTIGTGQTGGFVEVRVRGDRRDERNERFFVNLVGPSGATLGKARGRIRILDND